MNDLSVAYMGASAILIGVCVWVYFKRQRGSHVGNRVLLPFILILSVIAIGGLWGANHEFVAHWLRGDKVTFAIRTPLGIPAPIYYLGSLAIMTSPVLMLFPPIFRRPWLVAALSVMATFPISYAALTPGC